MDRISEYANKCRILRQIQSNKARLYRHINTAQSIATVVVSSFLTFIGFSGIEKIQQYLGWFIEVEKIKVEFAFNLLVFFLFVLVILHLVFQFGEKQAQSERAIVSLSNMINYVEDIIEKSKGNYSAIESAEQDLVRQRYEMLIEIIPANSDREFLNAKKDYMAKEAKQHPIQLEPTDLFDETQHKRVIESLIRNSSQVMRILNTLRQVDTRLYLGGGIIRNLVWDYLHGFQSPTPIDDVDVVYFDRLSAKKEHDRVIEEQLTQTAPNLRWSVKNQARMHTFNHEAPYESLNDALSKWPETATSLAVRVGENAEINIVAPHGFSDLFRLLVTPTPHFIGKEDRVRKRVEEKEWVKKWPRLRIVVNGAVKPKNQHNEVV